MRDHQYSMGHWEQWTDQEGQRIRTPKASSHSSGESCREKKKVTKYDTKQRTDREREVRFKEIDAEHMNIDIKV